jgi:signal peptidase I
MNETLPAILALSCIFCSFAIGVSIFSAEGYQMVTARGTSMYPTIKNGDKLLINTNIPDGNLTGAILVFGQEERICHRCTLDSGSWLTFKGDNRNSTESCSRDELVAIFVTVL